ncbi:hypothetical protein FDENT_5493 [Fusarium denticulatum]|uniref:Uncharacterized protein n=1 Tax=Fusarium denticulatum TaxID=48507 RepID=A0A8H5XAD3_9HYPO|nr:hypothetical protein FDENT_5493 [Fusarium denticulatum]
MPGHEDRYHWAFIVDPENETKNSQRKRFHVKKLLKVVGDQQTVKSYWHFEEIDISTAAPSMILTRVLIGKVKDLDRLRFRLRHTPIQQEVKAWNWIDWIEAAFYEITQDCSNLETCVMKWEVLRDTVMRYIELKTLAHRFDGTRAYDFTKVPTWDMFRGAEVIP